MKYFYDTEFVEDGTTIDLISIGIVADDGREYYAHVDGYDQGKAETHPFVSREVLPYVKEIPKTPRDQVARDILRFIYREPRIQLWGYFPSYDHVALAQLYGTMMDLPKHIPMRTSCIAQLGDLLGRSPNAVKNDSSHDALADARWTRDAYLFITSGMRSDHA